EQLYEFLKESPQDPFLHYAVATELLKAGETEQALVGFEQLTSKYPDYVGTYYHLGKLYEQLGRPEDAIVTYEAGMNIALKVKNRHAHGELQRAWAAARGEEDDEY